MSPTRSPGLGKSFPRRPYLSWTEDPATTMTIRYGSSNPETESILFGDGEELNYSAVINPGREKEVTLKDLKPGSLYRYQIGEQGAIYSFHTAPGEPVPFSFVVYGDYAQLGNRAVKLQLYKNIPQEKPAFMLFTGDLVSNGNKPDRWRREFFGAIGQISPYIPLMAVPGNHDGSGSLFRYYLSYPGKRSWYSFVYSNALFIGLNTQLKYLPGSRQYNFLINTLQHSKADWKLVYMHKPPYSTNSGHHSDLKVRSILCPLFERFGVDVVFCGHNHGYERTRPIYQNRVDQDKGVTYITTGGGGAILIPFIPRRRLTRAERQWSLVRIKDHHYLQVKVENQSLSINAKNQQGKIIDHFEKSQ